MDRCSPIHNQASISALNNAHAVYVHQVKDQRKANQANLYKMVDDQTTRVRNGQQKLNDTQHDHRKYYDDERAKSDMLLALSTTCGNNSSRHRAHKSEFLNPMRKSQK